MTDKQIIIDGVDVSGCEFFDSGNCVECDMRVHFYGDIPCDDECNRNCYYKQLLRKEQECEELENENKRLVAELANPIFDSFEELDILKQTLTEIKEIVTLDKTSFKYAGSTISICDDILIKISEVTND